MDLNSMELVDILRDVLYVEIVEYDNMSTVAYFKQRMENESVTPELMSESIGILEELLNCDELEKMVDVSENKQSRRKNLNELVTICEKLAGVNRK